MANESVYVAIGIASVMALLMLAIFVIYCIKRQQDKALERRARERRAREERHRRHHWRTQLVRPPPYEASGDDQGRPGPRQARVIPQSPPPEYKEVATPLPSARRYQSVGIGGMANTGFEHDQPPQYSEVPTVSRNVAPVNTYYHTNNNNNNTNIQQNHTNSQQQRRRGDNNPNNRNTATITHTMGNNSTSNQTNVTPRSVAAPASPLPLPDVVPQSANTSNSSSTHNRTMSRQMMHQSSDPVTPSTRIEPNPVISEHTPNASYSERGTERGNRNNSTGNMRPGREQEAPRISDPHTHSITDQVPISHQGSNLSPSVRQNQPTPALQELSLI